MSETREARLEKALRELADWVKANQFNLPAEAARLLRENAWKLYDDTSPEATPQPPTPEPERPAEPAAWIEHHKGGDNLVWDDPGGDSTPLYRGAERPAARCVFRLRLAPDSGPPVAQWVSSCGNTWTPIGAVFDPRTYSHCPSCKQPLVVEAPHA